MMHASWCKCTSALACPFGSTHSVADPEPLNPEACQPLADILLRTGLHMLSAGSAGCRGAGSTTNGLSCRRLVDELDALAVPGFDLPAEALAKVPQEDSQAAPLASLAGLGLDGLGPAAAPASAAPAQAPASPTLVAAGLEGLVFDPQAPGAPAGVRTLTLHCSAWGGPAAAPASASPAQATP